MEFREIVFKDRSELVKYLEAMGFSIQTTAWFSRFIHDPNAPFPLTAIESTKGDLRMLSPSIKKFKEVKRDDDIRGTAPGFFERAEKKEKARRT